MFEDGPGPDAPALPSIEIVHEPVAAIHPDGRIAFSNAALDAWFPGHEGAGSLCDYFTSFKWKRVGRSIGRYGMFWKDIQGRPPGSKAETLCELRILPCSEFSGLWLVRVTDATRVREKEVLLEQYSQIIESHAAKLERQKRRTQELLDHMRQAVFCVDQSMQITGPVSKHTLEMFGEDVEGRMVLERVFARLRPGSEGHGRLLTAFCTTLGEDDLQWELQEDLFPTRVEYSAPGSDDVRALLVSYAPIWDADGLVDRIMLVIEDRTEAERLQREVAEQKRRSARNIQMIQELAELDRADLERFLDKTARALSRSADLARRAAPDARALFRALHTQKGNARAFGLSLLSTAIHDAESAAARLRDEDGSGAELRNEVLDAIDRARASLCTYSQLARRVFQVEDAFARAAVHEVRRHLVDLDAELAGTPLHPNQPDDGGRLGVDPARLQRGQEAAAALHDAARWANFDVLVEQVSGLQVAVQKWREFKVDTKTTSGLVLDVETTAQRLLRESPTMSAAHWGQSDVAALGRLVDRLHDEPITARAMHHGAATCQSRGWWFLGLICERLEAHIVSAGSDASAPTEPTTAALLHQARLFSDFCTASAHGDPDPVRQVLARHRCGPDRRAGLEDLVRTDNAAARAALDYLSASGPLGGALRLSPLSRSIDMMARLGGRPLDEVAGDRSSLPQPSMSTVVTGHLERVRQLLGEIATGAVPPAEAAEALLLLDGVPAVVALARLGPMVRDLADALHKRVDFALDGGDVLVPRQAADPLFEAALHLVRNAVDHGIEVPAARMAAGKPERGAVELSLERRDGRLVLCVQDDGAGIELDKLRRRAVAAGLVGAEQAAEMADDALQSLIFEPGLSTAAHVSEVSGRGIGMDVVEAVAARLGGGLSVSSEPGVGTRICLSFPTS